MTDNAERTTIELLGDEVKTSLPIVRTVEEVLGREEDKAQQRALAAALSEQLNKATFAAQEGKRTTKGNYLANILANIAVNGMGHTLEGEAIIPESYKEWLDTIKFIYAHIDGPPRKEVAIEADVLFKVYAGFDPGDV